MTSRTTKKNPASSAGAFTLLEIVLAIGLLAVLVAVGAMTLGASPQRQRLEAGAERMETALMLARTDAARLGKRIRLAPDIRTGALRLLVESEPDSGDEEFTDYAACMWADVLPTEMVSVRRMERTGPSAYRSIGAERRGGGMTEQGAAVLEELTFYPDGSSDSAVIELASTWDEDVRTAVVEIDGVNGTIRRRILTPTEYEEYETEQAEAIE